MPFPAPNPLAASTLHTARQKHLNQGAAMCEAARWPCLHLTTSDLQPTLGRIGHAGILAQGATVITIATGAVIARSEAQRKRRLEEEATRQVRAEEMAAAESTR